MTIRIKKPKKPVTSEELAKLEEAVGCKLPTDYRQFLRQNNGGIPETNEFEIPKVNNSSGVSEFLTTREVLSEKQRLGRRLLEEAYPIAQAEGGNLVCIMLGRDTVGQIYFWDHELEAEEAELPSSKNMFELASSFEEFWNSLKKFDPNTVELKPGQVKKAWIDPDFLKSLESGEN